MLFAHMVVLFEKDGSEDDERTICKYFKKKGAAYVDVRHNYMGMTAFFVYSVPFDEYLNISKELNLSRKDGLPAGHYVSLK